MTAKLIEALETPSWANVNSPQEIMRQAAARLREAEALVEMWRKEAARTAPHDCPDHSDMARSFGYADGQIDCADSLAAALSKDEDQ